MAVMLVTLVIMLLVVLGLAVGVLAGRKPLAGSCGGVGRALGEADYVCPLCDGDEAKCEEEKAKGLAKVQEAPREQFYDATRK